MSVRSIFQIWVNTPISMTQIKRSQLTTNFVELSLDCEKCQRRLNMEGANHVVTIHVSHRYRFVIAVWTNESN